MPNRSSVQIASYNVASQFNDIQPASGVQPQEILEEGCEQCSTFSYFEKYRQRAKVRAAARQHAALSEYMKQNHAQRTSSSEHSQQARYNPVKRRVIANNSNHTASSSDY